MQCIHRDRHSHRCYKPTRSTSRRQGSTYMGSTCDRYQRRLHRPRKLTYQISQLQPMSVSTATEITGLTYTDESLNADSGQMLLSYQISAKVSQARAKPHPPTPYFSGLPIRLHSQSLGLRVKPKTTRGQSTSSKKDMAIGR